MTQTAQQELHPNWYHEIPVMKTLILGSFPPHFKRWSYDFYYPNNNNQFWDILAGINGSSLRHYRCDDAVRERQQLMKIMKVGVENLGQRIERQGESAADKDIEIIEFRNILGIIRRHRELERILLPGYSGPSSTLRAFVRYLKQNKIREFALPKIIGEHESFVLHFEGRNIECIVLNSTSPRNGMNLEDRIEQFRPYLLL